MTYYIIGLYLPNYFLFYIQFTMETRLRQYTYILPAINLYRLHWTAVCPYVTRFLQHTMRAWSLNSNIDTEWLSRAAAAPLRRSKVTSEDDYRGQSPNGGQWASETHRVWEYICRSRSGQVRTQLPMTWAPGSWGMIATLDYVIQIIQEEHAGATSIQITTTAKQAISS